MHDKVSISHPCCLKCSCHHREQVINNVLISLTKCGILLEQVDDIVFLELPLFISPSIDQFLDVFPHYLSILKMFSVLFGVVATTKGGEQ